MSAGTLAVKTDPAAVARVPWRIRIPYALPAFSLAVIGIPVYVYLPKFYTDTIGIDIATVGLLLLLVRMFDAVTDPVIGFLSDTADTRWGRLPDSGYAGCGRIPRPGGHGSGSAGSTGP